MDWLTLPLAAIAAVFTGYLVLLTTAAIAARLVRRPALPPGPPRHRFAVVVPAHNEAATLPSLLPALAMMEYPRPRYEVVVVADNCADDTAAVALAHGARVLARTDPARRSKGHALAWAFARLLAEWRHDAFVILDADCRPAPDLLHRLDAALRAGASVAQAHCVVGNPEQSWRTALMAADMALINYLRPAGRQALGASADLQGSGVCLSASLLRQIPWQTVTVAEDHEYHARLLLHGIRAVFVPDAVVHTLVEPTMATAREQELRWEGGRLALARRYVGPLLRAAWCRRRGRWWSCLAAALDLTTPPFALLAAGTAAMTAVHTVIWAAGGAGWPIVLWAALLAGQAAYVFAGCALAGVPPRAYAALFLYGPLYAVAKIGYYVAVARGASAGWIPTPRGAASWSARPGRPSRPPARPKYRRIPA
ncbi:MAG: glycosyltransferase family 2 protein [Candidatus Rokuibacteriota bacterium]